MVIKKRGLSIIFLILFCLIGLVARLVQIQLTHTESFSSNRVNLIEESVVQRTQEMVIDQGRGRFVDRNNLALTHEYHPTLVLFPFLKNIEWPVSELAKAVGVQERTIEQSLKDAKEPFVFSINGKPFELTQTQMSEINRLKIPGVFAINRQYELDTKIAEHLIGLVRENEELLYKRYPDKTYLSKRTMLGITGLQATFDEFLLPEGEAKLLYHVSGDGSPLFGIDVKYSAPANPFYPVAIKTTIDREIQQLAESIIDNHTIEKGGLILLDIETNDILAMVSKPSINFQNPFGDDGAENQMLMSQFPGSVFKTVIAAAAIEKNVNLNNRIFDCDLNLYGDGPSQYDHGPLNFKDSFAKSCNYTFAELSNEIIKEDSNFIEEYAQKLGLLGPVGWHGDVFRYNDFIQMPKEYPGRIWSDSRDKSSVKAVAQTAIGQKDVRVTPLAIANMMATIARGGEKMQVRSVSDVLYKNGTTLFSFPEYKLDGDSISPYTAMRLQELLRTVVQSGTGIRFNSLPYEVAGKSGTAETGKVSSEGNKNLVNKWFAGYFPFNKPKYALVVVDLDRKDGNSVTNSVFYDVVKGLYELDNKDQSNF
ncbi:penicillin-binding protein 2 [Bacillus luteolus]|uniref:serine-type D-Ala-D-Ala carboxypeptidase n=1 Tax=Litchfieldia luteola TaxID=682179 RepID=A0ABR9QHV2_9BACI|nr:penicillin-binding protein 2 [Cytobacillus luteolus]MBE4908074.1 penicillin-binding protein 2 [Cytobacillus luteolus]MBP1942859.1 cell division protein FtsI/penicillin-binding protein 2 [Cytobacillus luteolus]